MIYTITNTSQSFQKVNLAGSTYDFTAGMTADVDLPSTPSLPQMFTVYQGSTLIQQATVAYTNNPNQQFANDGRAVGTPVVRPANTTAYVSGQLVANSTTAGSVTPITFTVVSKPGSAGKASAAKLSKTSPGVSGASFRLHIYRNLPTVTNGDGGSWLSTSSVYLGFADITIDKVFSDEANGTGVFKDSAGNIRTLNFDTAAGSQNIYGLIEARGAYTPVSGETFTATLEITRD